jgi:hypothetical protein
MTQLNFPVKLFLLSVILTVLFVQKSVAQNNAQDTLIIEKEDTVLMKSYASRYDPRKALLFAAVVPGLGQVYNKKYWKLPLVYGGFAVLGWNVKRFHDFHTTYKEQLYYNINHTLGEEEENPESGITTRQLRSIEQRSRRERDFWIIMMGAMYLLQMVDAHVDSHLKEFDINPNLKVAVEPTFKNDIMLGRQTGVSFTVRF